MKHLCLLFFLILVSSQPLLADDVAGGMIIFPPTTPPAPQRGADYTPNVNPMFANMWRNLSIVRSSANLALRIALANRALISALDQRLTADDFMDNPPEIESCCLTIDECAPQLVDTNVFIKGAFEVLEKNLRTYLHKKKIYEARMGVMRSLASSGVATGAVVAKIETEQIMPAKREWMEVYDIRTKENINKLYRALLKVNELERDYCPQQGNWLQMHAFTLILTLKARYERAGAKAVNTFRPDDPSLDDIPDSNDDDTDNDDDLPDDQNPPPDYDDDSASDDDWANDDNSADPSDDTDFYNGWL